MTKQELDIMQAYISYAKEDADRTYQDYKSIPDDAPKEERLRAYKVYSRYAGILYTLECLAADLKRGHL